MDEFECRYFWDQPVTWMQNMEEQALEKMRDDAEKLIANDYRSFYSRVG